MKVLVVENEKPAADKICSLLRKIDSSIEVKGVLETVESSISWLQDNPAPDLILMDIQLDDGLCFEIFEAIRIEVPVIFTTAYDEYTLKAFKVNSVDYLLKPVEESALSAAIEKYRKVFSGRFPFREDIEKIIRDISGQHKSRFLIKTGLGYKSIPVNEISHFHICERSVFLKDKTGKDYGLDYSLDQLQKVLDPDKFFRINRDCIISIDSISRISAYSSSRLQLTIPNERDNDIFIVSRDKAGEFKKWIDR
jgi:DNA-binding LytR/AlgR family response regulator